MLKYSRSEGPLSYRFVWMNMLVAIGNCIRFIHDASVIHDAGAFKRPALSRGIPPSRHSML
jgi:hypothetical protein